MIDIALTPSGPVVRFGDVVIVNNPDALAFVFDAITAGAPLGPTINGKDRTTEASDIDAASELYVDGDDIDTSYDLLDEEPFDV